MKLHFLQKKFREKFQSKFQLKFPIFLLIYSAIASTVSGCATEMARQFARIEVGMEKDDVLSLLDSPQRTQRWKSQDRWTYIFYQDKIRQEKEVHFENGKAIYVGDHQNPPVSAESKDLKNEQQNSEVEKMLNERAKANQGAFPKYEEQVKGSDQQIRYVPQFTPIE